METAAFVCSHVFADCSPVLLVSRADGDWQLLCGSEHAAGEVPKVVGLVHFFERDRTLLEIRDLAVGWEAERTHVGAPWHRVKTVSAAH